MATVSATVTPTVDPVTPAPLPLDELVGIEPLLTDEERGWRDRARRLARDVLAPSIERDFDEARLRDELIPAIAEAGLLGMHLRGHGCAGAGAVSYGLACAEIEAVDSSWRTLVSVQGSLAMSAIAMFGSEEQKASLLPRMARGELLGCFGLTEPQGGSDPGGMTTAAVRDGDDWVIDGAKRWIGLASIADVCVLWARTDEGIRGFVVDTASPGFTATPIEGKRSMRASVQCDIRLEGLRIPDSARLPGATGLSAALRCLNEARYGIVWGVTGAARACLQAAVDRSIGREVFGRPVGAMQLTQGKLADMLVAYETSVLLALHLGRAKEAGRLRPEQISIGKLNNVREAQRIARTARTILGGDGITDEFPVMRHMANLESVQTYEGTDEIHALVLGRALTGLSAFG